MVGICGHVVGMVGTNSLLKIGSLATPRGVAIASSDADGLVVTTSK